MKDKVIILMSSYNGEAVIRKQLQSIYKQTMIDKIDILVRDDGSKDRTCSILQEYKENYDNFNFIEGNNIGLNESFFQLLKCAGEYRYYAFADQDDEWFEDKIEEGFRQLEQQEASIPLLYGSCSLMVDGTGKELGITQRKRKNIQLANTAFQNILPGHSQIFNHELKKILDKTVNLHSIYVYDSWVTLCASCFGKILFNNNYYTYYYQHEGNAYGYGSGIVNWIKVRWHRLSKGETKDYKAQDKLFYDTFKEKLSFDDRCLLNAVIEEKNVFQRIIFILKYKPYRQRGIETILLYILILLNKY